MVAPDIQVHFMPALENAVRTCTIPKRRSGSRRVEETHGFSLRVGPIVPESRGWIGLRSSRSRRAGADPAQLPAETRPTAGRPIAGIRIRSATSSRSRPSTPIAASELAPGEAVQSDEELTAWLRANAVTTFHPVGTCRMGRADPMAVVDARLKVHGLDGLRVADASVMPVITSGNTNAAAIMIGEKAAQFIREASPGSPPPSP